MYKGHALPVEFKVRFNNRIFGCDICQDVCPWNKNVNPHNEPGLKPNPALMEMTRDNWYNLDEKKFNEIFNGSAVKRLKYDRFRRNLEFLWF